MQLADTLSSRVKDEMWLKKKGRNGKVRNSRCTTKLMGWGEIWKIIKETKKCVRKCVFHPVPEGEHREIT